MLKNWINEWKSSKQQKEKNIIVSEVTETYNIICRNDKLYLIADGIPVSIVDDKTTAKDIIKAIKDMRASALAYKNIELQK